jgi:hypothetical protein
MDKQMLHTNRKIIRPLFFFCFLFFLTGCNVNNSGESPEEEPYVTGEITEVKQRADHGYSVRVAIESWTNLSADPGEETILFVFTDRSEIFKEKQQDESLILYSDNQLEAGQRVQGWPRGKLIASLYLSSEAKRLVVIGEIENSSH